MLKYKNTHFNRYRVVLERFLKVGEARLYKLSKFVHFGASTPDDKEILGRGFLESGLLERLRIVASSRVKGR